LWLFAFFPVLLIAARFFDRFDPARGGRLREANAEPARVEIDADSVQARWHVLTPLPKFAFGWRPLTQLFAELSLMFKRRSLWWYGVVVGFWIAGIAIDTDDAVKWIVPIAWLWGLTTFSEHGARAEIHGTSSLLASAPSPLLRQLPVQWLAATLFALVLVVPVVVKLLVLGALGTAAQIAAGAAFVSALTLALGALSGGSRLFELTFLMLWYAAIQNVPGARFTGNPEVPFAVSQAPSYLLLGTVLFALACLLRAIAMRR